MAATATGRMTIRGLNPPVSLPTATDKLNATLDPRAVPMRTIWWSPFSVAWGTAYMPSRRPETPTLVRPNNTGSE